MRKLILPSLVALGAIVVLSGSTRAQTKASYTFFGTHSCPRSEILQLIALPVLGKEFVVRIPGLSQYVYCPCCMPNCRMYFATRTPVLVTSAQPRSAPIDLAATFGGSSCGILRVGLDHLLFAGPSAPWGTVDIRIRIPNSRALMGVVFFQQVVVADTHVGFTASKQAARGVIGV